MTEPDAAPDETLTRETERRLALVTSRFPDRFDVGQVEQIRARIERSIRLGRSLRTTTLTNGDGPDLIVTALPPGTPRE